MSSKTLVAFAIDDDEGELELLRRALDELTTIEIELHAYTDPNLALTEFLNHDADLIFLDYQLGEMTAIDVLEQMRRIGDLRPAIVLTGHGDEYAAAELTRAGADDYIVKNDLNSDKLKDAIARSLAAYGKRLSEAEVVKHAFELERANDQLKLAKRDLERMNARLQDLSDTDTLTGVSNRRYFVNRGEKELSRAIRNGDPVSIALVDIDGFGLVQDRHGKPVCDQIVERVAGVIQQAIRQYDVVARLDGETFAIVFPNTDLDNAAGVAERCRASVLGLSLPLATTGATIGVSVSIGVTCTAVGGTYKLDSLMQSADRLLQRARGGGGNQVILDEGGND